MKTMDGLNPMLVDTATRCHFMFDFPRQHLDCLRLAKNVFESAGFGSLTMKVFESGTPEEVTVMLKREGEGQPTVFAEYLAQQVICAKMNSGGVLDEKSVRRRTEPTVKALEEDGILRAKVMERSLLHNASGLEETAQLICKRG